jgi:hypothetical protein
MKKLIVSMFSLSLLVLFALSVNSSPIAVDSDDSLLAHCGSCDKDEDNDEHEHEDGDEEDDSLLAHCGSCDKDEDNDEHEHEDGDEEDALV